MNVDESLLFHILEPFLAYDERVKFRDAACLSAIPLPPVQTWLETCNENEPWPGLEMVPGYSGRYCKVPDHWDANMIVTAAYIWAHHRNPYFGKHTQSVMARAYPSLNIRCVKPDHLYSRSFIQIYQTPYDLVDTVFVYVEDGASADFTHDARFTEQDYTALADMLAESVLGDTEGIMYSYRVRDLQPAATPSCPIFQWFEKAGYDLQMSIHIMLDDRDLDTLRFHFRPHTESLKSYTHDEMLQILFDLRIAARPKAFKWQPYFELSNFLPPADLMPENFSDYPLVVGLQH